MVHTGLRTINWPWITSVWELEECFQQLLRGSSGMTFQVKQLEEKNPQFLSKLTRQICSGDYSIDKNCQVFDNNTKIPFALIFLSCLQHKTMTKCRNILRPSASTCNKREAKWTSDLTALLFKHLFCSSWEQGNGVETTHVMLIQTNETRCWCAVFHAEKLNTMSPSSVRHNFCKIML